MELETARLYLRPLPLECLRQGARTGDVGPLLGFPPEKASWTSRMASRRIYAAKTALTEQFPEAWLLCTAWQLITKESVKLVGEAGFKGPPARGELEIGYGTRAPYRGRGYMSEAVEALCRFAFVQTVFRIVSVCAATRKDNYASQRVLLNCGFEHAGDRGRLLLWRRTNHSNEQAEGLP